MKLFTAALILVAGTVGFAAADYHIVGHINVGGDGGWDYLTVDSASRRLYVSHATHVVVIDLDSEKVIGDIPDTPGVHGIAIVPDLNRGFISNGRGNNVTVFDLKTLKMTSQIPTGQNPDAIIYEPKSKMVYTLNGRSKDATVIDAATGTVKSTIPLGGKPEFAVVDGHGGLWANIEDTHEIAVFDTAKASVAGRYLLEGCEEPSGLALDAKRHRLFSVCGNKVMVVSDPAAGKILATLPIGEGSDGAAFDPGSGLAFSSNGEGNITVVGESGGKYKVSGTVPSQRSARTIAIDPTTHKLYLPAAKLGPVPAPTAAQPRPRPSIVPGSFEILVVSQ